MQGLCLEEVSIGNASCAHREKRLSLCAQHPCVCLAGDCCIRNRKYPKWFNKWPSEEERDHIQEMGAGRNSYLLRSVQPVVACSEKFNKRSHNQEERQKKCQAEMFIPNK